MKLLIITILISNALVCASYFAAQRFVDYICDRRMRRQMLKREEKMLADEIKRRATTGRSFTVNEIESLLDEKSK